jgi:hypothetical protein
VLPLCTLVMSGGTWAVELVVGSVDRGGGLGKEV